MTVTTTVTGPSVPISPPMQGMPGQLAGAQTAQANGAVGTSRHYYDESSRRRRAAMDVPVDQWGKLTSALFRCSRCADNRWVPLAVAAKGAPMCQTHGRRMKRQPIRPVGLVPLATWRAKVVPQLWPLFIGLVVAGLGQTVHTRHVSPFVLAAAAAPAGLLIWIVVRHQLLARARGAGSLRDEDAGRRRRNQIGARARAAGRWTVASCLWLAAAALFGVDTNTTAGRIMLTVLAVVWVFPAATWWRWRRRLSSYRAAKGDDPGPSHMDVPMDPDEEQCRQVWLTIVAVRKGANIGTDAAGKPILAERQGRLVDTRIEEWRSIHGGWAATIVGPDGMYTADKFEAARGAIAGAYRMKTPMVTVIPDGDDENRATVLAQRVSPIREAVRWAGPTSIDPERGIAPVGEFADGAPVPYELYRPGWGSPHVFCCGTTGAGKSEFLSLLFAIDRWASYIPDGGAEADRRGMVASFLIDPQQGQSFAPFLEDLAAPVASSLEEAMVLVEALLSEMHRRNRYLAREAKTWDPKRRKWRAGRKWWNPLIDGPILSLTIDEAHLFLAVREFCSMVTGAGRMWRKCGGQLRIGTQTPLLVDLGGSMPLRDMLTGGTVAVFRTANALTGHTAFNGRLAADPRQIPQIPGTMYALTGERPKAMLARAAWDPDWYDWVRDLNDSPIGYPAMLPPETLEAFGPQYAAWVRHASQGGDAGPYVPAQTRPPATEVSPRSVEAVRLALAAAPGLAAAGALDLKPDLLLGVAVEDIDRILRSREVIFSVRTIRDALKRLRDGGEVVTDGGRHRLTDEAMAAVVGSLPERVATGD